MEVAQLGIFMISAGVFTILLYYPESPAVCLIPAEIIRRALTGLAMGLTLISLVYSPWGKQSGAHMNPAFTLMFYRLGKISFWDAAFYVVAQFVGGIAGIAVLSAVAHKFLAHPAVNYAATLPGKAGVGAAFAGEFCISFLLAGVVLTVSNSKRFSAYAGIAAGMCVATFITFESPLSGMSMNPARTLGSALLPGLWNSLWVYFVAPPLGMLTGAALRFRTLRTVACAKLHHHNKFRCIFCEYQNEQLKPRLTKTPISVTQVNSI